MKFSEKKFYFIQNMKPFFKNRSCVENLDPGTGRNRGYPSTSGDGGNRDSDVFFGRSGSKLCILPRKSKQNIIFCGPLSPPDKLKMVYFPIFSKLQGKMV